MTQGFILEEIRGGSPIEIGRVLGPPIALGRDPGEGIVVDNAAVSRTHGIVWCLGSHWFYRDLGSTNGSWVNGRQIRDNEMSILREGDVMQLADTTLRITGANAALGMEPPAPSLLVFTGQEFVEEFPLRMFGRVLAIGGSEADLALEESLDEMPALIVERRDHRLFALRNPHGVPASVNGASISGEHELRDRDEVRIGKYSVLVSMPTMNESSTAAPPIPEVSVQTSPAGRAASWLPSNAPEDSPEEVPSGSMRMAPRVFGQRNVEQEEAEATIAIDPRDVSASITGFDIHPSMRYQLQSRQTSATSWEDRIIVLVGTVLLLGIIIVMLWWAFM